MKICPSEYDECVAFVDWLRLNNIPHAHYGNESQSGTKNAMIRGAKLKRIGQSRGVFDYDIFIPIKGVTGEIDCYQELRVEMKRVRGGTVSPEQKEWLKIYELAGVPARICKGADEAIEFVKEYLPRQENTV